MSQTILFAGPYKLPTTTQKASSIRLKSAVDRVNAIYSGSVLSPMEMTTEYEFQGVATSFKYRLDIALVVEEYKSKLKYVFVKNHEKADQARQETSEIVANELSRARKLFNGMKKNQDVFS